MVFELLVELCNVKKKQARESEKKPLPLLFLISEKALPEPEIKSESTFRDPNYPLLLGKPT